MVYSVKIWIYIHVEFIFLNIIVVHCIYSTYTNFFHKFIQTVTNLWLIGKARGSESGGMGLNPAGCWNSMLHLGHFVWHWAWACQWSQVDSLLYFYIAGLKFGHWQSQAEYWHEHQTFTVLEHLESGPGPWLGHLCSCAGLVHRQWLLLLYCLRAIWPEKARAWPLLFLEMSKILKKSGPSWGFSNPGLTNAGQTVLHWG